MSIATRARAAILPCASIPSWPTTVLEESPLSQGAPRRGRVWRIEAGPEIREADFGIEPMRSMGSMQSVGAPKRRGVEDGRGERDTQRGYWSWANTRQWHTETHARHGHSASDARGTGWAPPVEGHTGTYTWSAQ